MSSVEVVARANAIRITTAVLDAIARWQRDTLDAARTLVIDWFGPQLLAFDPADPIPVAERATILADQIIAGWIGQRAFLCNVVLDTLGPVLVETLHGVNQLAATGQVVAQHFDEMTRELDAEMREMIEDVAAVRAT